MCFKYWGSAAVLLLVSLSAMANERSLPGKSSELLLTPNKCVALREGRACFATISVKWQVAEKGNYCLQRRDDKLIIHCWENEREGDYLYVFRSQKKEDIDLIFKKNRQIITSSAIRVRWVYRSKRQKNRWRVF